jgi:hypothetical protein
MGPSGGQSLPALSAGLTIDQGNSSEKLVASNGHADRAGPALKRLRDDPVLGYGDEANEATRRRAAWRQVILSRARRARHELLSAWAATPPGPGQDRRGEEPAELILKAKASALQRVSAWSWLEGCYQEQAWLALHEADAQIIELLPPEELLARADGMLQKARHALGGEDPRVQCIQSLLGEPAPSESKLRPRLAHLARATFDSLDDKYAQSRGYRNRLIRLTSLASAGIALPIIAGRMSQLNFHLADNPDARGWRMVVLIMLFGSVGALITAIPPLAKANGVRNPFSLPFFQLLLKLAMGPLFAIVGVLILQDQLITGLQAAKDLGGLLVYATLFGAAQQSVTRFIDKRVTGLLGEVPVAASSNRPAAKPLGQPQGHGTGAS